MAEFDPKAYLQESAAGFDPKEYLGKTKEPLKEIPEATPEQKRQAAKQFIREKGLPSATEEALYNMGSSMLAKPISDVAGLAAMAYSMTTGDYKDPVEFKAHVQDVLTYSPKTPLGKVLAEYNPMALIGKVVGGGAKAAADVVRGGEKDATSLRGMAGNLTEEALQQGAGFVGVKGAPKGMAAIESGMKKAGEAAMAGKTALTEGKATLTGSNIPPIREAAQAAARSAAETSISQQQLIIGQETAQATNMARIRDTLDKKLADPLHDAQGKPVPELADQGQYVAVSMKAAYDTAKQIRAKAAKEEFEVVRKEAAGKESAGKNVDTTEIMQSLNSFKTMVSGIPVLETTTNQMMTAIGGRTSVAPTKAIPAPTQYGTSVEALRERRAGMEQKQATIDQPTVSVVKTFDQLETARQYLNDIAFSGNLEGYTAQVRNKARDISSMLDTQMQAFAPSFAKYKENYATRSMPLHSLDTRLGKLATGTEGGLQGTAYSKTAVQDLPKKLFSTKDGIELVVDALSGGKTAPMESRLAAQKTVDGMVENWILKSTEGQTGAKASEFIGSPNMKSTLMAAPSVEESLSGRFASRAAIEASSQKLSSNVKAAQAKVADTKKQMQVLQLDLANSDALASLPDPKSKQQALQGYLSIIKKNKENVSPEKYQATIELLSRQETLQAQTDRARRIAKGIMTVGISAVVGKELLR